MKYLLDTGVWYRGIVASQTIPGDVRKILADAEARFGLSAISLWEIGKKAQIGKLHLNLPVEGWLEAALSAQIQLLPLSPRVVGAAMTLPAFPNRDPADELIVATAKVHGLTLLTSDRALRTYRHVSIEYFKPLSDQS